MTAGEQPSRGDEQAVPPPIPLETEDAAPISEEQMRPAQLAADITELLHHPAFSTVTEMDEKEAKNPLAPTSCYTQQMVLGYKISRVAQGNPGPLVNSDITKQLHGRRLGICVKSIHDFHVSVQGWQVTLE